MQKFIAELKVLRSVVNPTRAQVQRMQALTNITSGTLL